VPPKAPYSKIYVAYSRRSDSWEYGTEYNQNYSSGVLQFTVNALSPNTKYYFKIRPGNGCMAGNWGNTMAAITTGSDQTRTFYKNFITSVVQQTKTVVTSVLTPIKKAIDTLVQPANPTPSPSVTPMTVPLATLAPIQTILPQITPQATPKPKFCIFWWCF
jgi:hypothetical protein